MLHYTLYMLVYNKFLNVVEHLPYTICYITSKPRLYNTDIFVMLQCLLLVCYITNLEKVCFVEH